MDNKSKSNQSPESKTKSLHDHVAELTTKYNKLVGHVQNITSNLDVLTKHVANIITQKK